MVLSFRCRVGLHSWVVCHTDDHEPYRGCARPFCNAAEAVIVLTDAQSGYGFLGTGTGAI
jgi:hypothetical protein